MRRMFLAWWVLAGCTTTDDGQPCGDVERCTDEQFCLVTYARGAATGEQVYACQPLPEGCEAFQAMCTADPPCGEDWVDLYCGEQPLSAGCSNFGGVEEAVCEL